MSYNLYATPWKELKMFIISFRQAFLSLFIQLKFSLLAVAIHIDAKLISINSGIVYMFRHIL
jgi:hypothetical protein